MSGEMFQWLGGGMWSTTFHLCMFADADLNSPQGSSERAAPRQAGEGENIVQISARRHDKTVILDVSGDIDFANSVEVRQSVLHEIRESRAPRVIVNLSQVSYVDSSGVASLVEGLKASHDLGSRFILFGLNPSVREVLELSRLIKVFEVYDNEGQALAA